MSSIIGFFGGLLCWDSGNAKNVVSERITPRERKETTEKGLEMDVTMKRM